MNRQLKYGGLFTILMAISLGALILSCGPKARTAVGEMDTPSHHTVAGTRLLDEGKYDDALREFDLALELDKRYAQAHAGRGLAKGFLGDLAAAFDAMKSAKKYADTKEDSLAVYIGYIRLHTMNRTADKNWLSHAEGAYEDALRVDPAVPAVYYFMGRAYKEAFDLLRAATMFSKVIALKGDYVGQADREWNLVQKIQRAVPGTDAGRKIAVLERITRADAAALFMEELKIDVLYRKTTPKSFDTGFKDPEKAKTEAAGGGSTATDIAGHPLKTDIEGIIRVGVRGLELYPDGSFHPNDFVDRAAYAMMIEDILIKVSGDGALATKFIGATSPFPDLRSDLPYFNAVMVVTSRGIMEVVNITSGEFAPLRPVAGVDALLVIRKIKEELKFF